MRLGRGVLLLVATASALPLHPPTTNGSYKSRRKALRLAAAAALPAFVGSSQLVAAEDTVKLYFGAGCFWHVQHEFVGEEVAALQRSGAQITSVVGYAGGQRLGDGGTVCYHNPRGYSDYGKLGHAEAVQVEVPVSAVPRFMEKYFSLFGNKGFRHDPQDRGGEYRSVLGLPGGTAGAMYAMAAKAAAESPGGMVLKAGSGDEEDTLSDKSVLVYDSNKFPFYAGELYHQFHNDFMGPVYGREYNNLLNVAYEAKRIGRTGCPDIQL